MEEAKEILLIKETVINGDEEQTYAEVKKAIEAGVSLLSILNDGLIAGAKVVGEKFEKGEYFLADLMLAGNALANGMELLRPCLAEQQTQQVHRGKILIATVETDIHDIGKNIVSSLLIAAGFEVVDLGVDVGCSKIIDAAGKEKVDIIALSSLLTTSRPYLKDVISLLNTAQKRSDYKVIVGGGALTADYAAQIGADGYAADAVKAVELVLNLMGEV
ncbi:corrinoid protein [Candidatus Formimonas warabiya]|uniref:Cobalamin-binding protein n=1 Tax=Formimonas warabiya TaxID=1761012 RepID=A0A3G1KQY2_FORW1|nr:corrinoid protein [Candidatus Formimonas warabiya]ATW24864.1 hypothetical protein DCMF_08830 [Candidatus Formimonas warabiya]